MHAIRNNKAMMNNNFGNIQTCGLLNVQRAAALWANKGILDMFPIDVSKSFNSTSNVKKLQFSASLSVIGQTFSISIR